MTGLVAVTTLICIALALYVLWARLERAKMQEAKATLEDLQSLGDIVPDTLYPRIDLDVCIGSGACVHACPQHVLRVVDGFAKLISPLGCIGHGACASACPVHAITLVFGSERRGVELPEVDEHFQTNLPGVYIIGELAGMGLIRNAIRQGTLAADHILTNDRRGRGDVLDAIVVGAGPAGISATLRLMQAGLRVQLLERDAFGGTIVHYPRAKVVMTGAIDIPLYGKVSKRTMSKEQLVALFKDVRTKTQLPVSTGELVEGLVAASPDTWSLRSSKGERHAANVLLALGRRGSPRKLGVPGEELPKVCYGVLEPEVFQGQHVLVVGGGNSAVESVFALIDQGHCKSISISYRRKDFPRIQKANALRIAEEIKKGTVRPWMPTEVVSIGQGQVELKGDDDNLFTIDNDAVIVQAGGTAPTELLTRSGIRIVTKYGEA